ncbi:MAG: AlpA family phage regulatory protein [Clostridia bacterium]|nr:AlpA family phage regulatory protein [Clostridia bacterium]MBQ3270933.1 AlpA family phage regulatory protein [Clostridia bacterium]
MICLFICRAFERFLQGSEVARICGLSRTTVYKYLKLLE